MRFLLDMGVARRISAWLRERGHDAVHLAEEGLHRAPDSHIFLKASQEKRIIVTFDLDFCEIAAFSVEPFATVILFRLHNTRTPFVIERLRNILNLSSEYFEKGSVIVVEDHRIRFRRLPIE